MQDTSVLSSSPQSFELRRAHQHFLPLMGERKPQADAVPRPSTIQVMPTAKAQLRGLMHSGGQYRGGPIFGKRSPTFEVHHAHLGGYGSLIQHDPLACSPEYLLGLTDAYQQALPDLDWVGHWLTWPHRQSPRLRSSQKWFERAHSLGLVSDEHGLLVVSWHQGRLSGSICFSEIEFSECHWIPIEI